MGGYLSGRTSLTTVQTADLAANAVTTAKILDGAVTAGKLASGVGGASTSDMRLAFLMIAENAGDRLSMDDGIADPFKDETDIDTSTSTNETYDAAGDYYSSPSTVTVVSAAAEWTDSNGTATFPNGDDIQFALDDAIKSVDTFTGDFEINWEWNTGNYFMFGVYPISEDGTFNANSSNSGFPSMTASVWIGYASAGVSEANVGASVDGGGSNLFSGAPTAGDALKFERVGSTFKIYHLGSVVHTFTHTSSVEMRMAGGDTSTPRSRIDSVSWTNVSTVANMTLVSNAFTATSVPATGRIHIQVHPVVATTINTDLTAEISRDSGTTWTVATLALTETLADGTLAYEDNSVDISSQPSGTAMKYRIKTLNTKEVRIHGAVFQWST